MIEIKTGHREWDEFWNIVKEFIESNRVEINHDGKRVKGFHSPDCPWLWFRDSIHYMEITPFLDSDLKSPINLMLNTQQDDGSFLDFIREDGSMLRVPTEADLEYLAVIGVYRAWLATGDDEWMRGCLPALKRGLSYMTSHPWRWDEKYQLPKRAYTIDTWDFDIREGLKELHWPGTIDDKTHFGIMHGDVSGLYHAYNLMKIMLRYLGKHEDANKYSILADDLRTRANKLLWNGKFYRHRLPLDDYRVSDINEDEQLSLSNPYDINRGLPTYEMSRSIIREYQLRRTKTKAFAEWFSIDPPFPAGLFGDDKLIPGAYVNGGIMPLVGGQLAKAAFQNGFPDYGIDILKRYFKMIDETGESYLWYFPDGRHATKEESTSPEAYATDPWGSSSMMSALVEGLAGIRCILPCFEAVQLAPLWDASGISQSEVKLAYPSSGADFQYLYSRDTENNVTEIIVKSSFVNFLHIVIQDNASSIKAESRGSSVDPIILKTTRGKILASFANFKDEIRILIE